MMTSNFKKWLIAYGPTEGDVEAICGLYNAADNRTSSNMYECSLAEGEFYIRARHPSKPVRIATEVARQAFLEAIVEYYCEGFPNLRSWVESKNG